MTLRVLCKMTSVLFFYVMHTTVLAMDPVISLLKVEVSEVTGIYYREFGLRTIVI